MVHGAARLPAVDVLSYSLEVRDEDGFLGDNARKGAFHTMLDDWRKALRKYGVDPFGKKPSDEIGNKALRMLLVEGDPEAAGVVQGAIEDFARELARIIAKFVELKSWRGIERVVIGGGFRETRVGELAIGRASVILKSRDIGIEVRPIRHDPDAAGLIGAVHLAPSWMFKGYNAVLAADIGGTNMRAGLVLLNLKGNPHMSKAEVAKCELWRHADDKPKRDEAVDELAAMVEKLISYADKQGHKVAPFIGIGCPGRIGGEGSIERGAQNLPGNWTSKGFNLPSALRRAFPRIGKHDTTVLLHNDAVVQGLSELPVMQHVKSWAILTIGTGLGNASFANRRDED